MDNDTYIIVTGDGVDTIWDAYGQRVIRFGTVEVKGKTGVEYIAPILRETQENRGGSASRILLPSSTR